MLRTVVDKSRRALLRYVPPEVTRHLPARFKGPRPIPGPPPGISIETLNSVCAEEIGGRIRRCAHQHVAAWKRHGTFRLYVVADNGAKRTFIFKDEIYTTDETPALSGLAVRPGQPEYYIYARSAGSPLSEFLPKVYWHAELEPGRHFRYLMEDLQLTHRRLHFRRKDLMFAVRVLVEAHKALRLMLAREQPNNSLIRYDPFFSEQILEYSRSNLEEYARLTGNKVVNQIVRVWPHIVKHHESNAPTCDALRQPIHGDYTLAHIHWKNGIDGAKIVDWEWAGIGIPHSDLAALLKWADPEIRNEAIRVFAKGSDRLSLGEHDRLLRWCLLERKLLDAGFSARQQITSKSYMSRPVVSRYFRRTVADVLTIAEGASRGRVAA